MQNDDDECAVGNCGSVGVMYAVWAVVLWRNLKVKIFLKNFEKLTNKITLSYVSQ